MSRLETKEHLSQDDLPPEIMRRLQVEELWARRNVLAPMMNVERLKVYAERRTGSVTWCTPMEIASSFEPATRAAKVVSMKSQRPFAPLAAAVKL